MIELQLCIVMDTEYFQFNALHMFFVHTSFSFLSYQEKAFHVKLKNLTYQGKNSVQNENSFRTILDPNGLLLFLEVANIFCNLNNSKVSIQIREILYRYYETNIC